MCYQEDGMMEYWNNGMEGKRDLTRNDPSYEDRRELNG
jgi:hypothetical protein